MERPTSSARARRRLNQLAGLGVLVWLGSFGAGPLLHSIDHQDDHIHLPSGAVVPLDAPPERPADTPGTPLDPASHGAGSLAHLGAGGVAPPPPSVMVAAAPVQVVLRAWPEPKRPHLSERHQPKVARGPPA